jgi:hypothetical protein
VYLGELGSRRGIAYHSRRLDPEGQSFVFRAEAAGTYTLKFYKQDFIRDYILNDYVQAIIGDPPETAGTGWFNPPIDRGRVVAEPRWPGTAEEAEARRRQGAAPGQAGPRAGLPAVEPPPAEPPAQPPAELRQPPEQEQVPQPAEPPVQQAPAPPQSPPDAPQTAAGGEQAPAAPAAAGPREGTPVPLLPPDTLPAEYLRRAGEEFDAGRVAAAIGILDQFRNRFPAGSDEAWWLYGQFYEANSPSRDIRTSLDYYRRLMREYPQSSRYDAARRRVAYLERFYINIQ